MISMNTTLALLAREIWKHQKAHHGRFLDTDYAEPTEREDIHRLKSLANELVVECNDALISTEEVERWDGLS